MLQRNIETRCYKLKLFILLIIENLVILAIFTLLFGQRLYMKYKRKSQTPNSFQIQNIKSKKAIRPYNAQLEDGTPIIQYEPKNWECTTWQTIEIEPHIYLFKDLYTQKTLQPKEQPTEGARLYQAPMGGTPLQHWELVPHDAESYYIKLKGYDLYITSVSDKTNEPLVLSKLNHTDNQLWTFKPQQPLI